MWLELKNLISMTENVERYNAVKHNNVPKYLKKWALCPEQTNNAALYSYIRDYLTNM